MKSYKNWSKTSKTVVNTPLMFGMGWLNANMFNDLFNWNLNHLALATTFGIIGGLGELVRPNGAGFFINKPKSKQEKEQAKQKRKEVSNLYKEQNGVGVFQAVFFPWIVLIGSLIYLLSQGISLFWSICGAIILAGFFTSSAKKEGQRELSNRANLKILQEGAK
jgi:hypothetical protein